VRCAPDHNGITGFEPCAELGDAVRALVEEGVDDLAQRLRVIADEVDGSMDGLNVQNLLPHGRVSWRHCRPASVLGSLADMQRTPRYLLTGTQANAADTLRAVPKRRADTGPPLLTSRRRAASRIVRSRIRAFDELNANADLARFAEEHMGDVFVPDPPWRERIYDHIARTALQPSIDYLEFGVWEGASLRYWAELVPDPASRFYGFDSFGGLPEDWRKGQPKGTFDLGGRAPRFDDPRIVLVPGLFQQTLTPFLDSWKRERQLVVHLDADIYSSTLFVLATLDRVVSTGDLVLFDDFSGARDEFRAFQDYRAAFRRSFSVLATVPGLHKLAIRLG